MTANFYSARWFEYFHADIPAERTDKEVEFVCSQAPLPAFRRAADICCGMGRHSRKLAALGYEVTGIERDAIAVDIARGLGGGPTYVHADILRHWFDERSFDLAVVMSQSFGYYSEDTNRELLARLALAVRERGVVILDLWNPDFFVAHQGTRVFNLQHGRVIETKSVVAGRLSVHLAYPDGGVDDFKWQLFTIAQIDSLTDVAGLRLCAACASYDAGLSPTPDDPGLDKSSSRKRDQL